MVNTIFKRTNLTPAELTNTSVCYILGDSKMKLDWLMNIEMFLKDFNINKGESYFLVLKYTFSN